MARFYSGLRNWWPTESPGGHNKVVESALETLEQ